MEKEKLTPVWYPDQLTVKLREDAASFSFEVKNYSRFPKRMQAGFQKNIASFLGISLQKLSSFRSKK
ncbi:hypothetical protein HDE69_002055 [Pedobacter cryoconitis]|uniref:Uncharacterized protein n=1 Tax=Pedobacter cryoconitis TaxID=188932 RepID=A0A7W8YSS0_9SPHI|nr:hypothetical protein [Pedobacter cryoconitis]MBB5621002.1 hypothetical protein [Pedobacter cryoconitis]